MRSRYFYVITLSPRVQGRRHITNAIETIVTSWNEAWIWRRVVHDLASLFDIDNSSVESSLFIAKISQIYVHHVCIHDILNNIVNACEIWHDDRWMIWSIGLRYKSYVHRYTYVNKALTDWRFVHTDRQLRLCASKLIANVYALHLPRSKTRQSQQWQWKCWNNFWMILSDRRISEKSLECT